MNPEENHPEENQNLEQEINLDIPSDELRKDAFDTNRLMGIAAVFISLLSLFAVLYQSFLAREENKMMRTTQSASVLPYLDFWYSNINNSYKFIIANKGVGPAFIKEVKFIGNDPTDQSTYEFDSSHAFFEHLEKHSEVIRSSPVIKYRINANTLMSKNEVVEVFAISFEDNDTKRKIRVDFQKLFKKFKIKYEDVYGSVWLLDSEIGYPLKN